MHASALTSRVSNCCGFGFGSLLLLCLVLSVCSVASFFTFRRLFLGSLCNKMSHIQPSSVNCGQTKTRMSIDWRGKLHVCACYLLLGLLLLLRCILLLVVWIQLVEFRFLLLFLHHHSIFFIFSNI